MVYFADHCMCVRTYGGISKIFMKFYITVILNNNKKANHLICMGNTENGKVFVPASVNKANAAGLLGRK